MSQAHLSSLQWGSWVARVRILTALELLSSTWTLLWEHSGGSTESLVEHYYVYVYKGLRVCSQGSKDKEQTILYNMSFFLVNTALLKCIGTLNKHDFLSWALSVNRYHYVPTYCLPRGPFFADLKLAPPVMHLVLNVSTDASFHEPNFSLSLYINILLQFNSFHIFLEERLSSGKEIQLQ